MSRISPIQSTSAVQSVGDGAEDAAPAVSLHAPDVAGRRDPGADYRAFAAMRDGTLDVATGMKLVDARGGWPIPTDTGFVVVFPGEHHGPMTLHVGTGTGPANRRVPMQYKNGMYFAEVPADTATMSRYYFRRAGHRLTDGWARQYNYDTRGREISLVRSAHSHIERLREMGSHGLRPRTVRMWIPKNKPRHVMYWNDGQHVLAPTTSNGFHLQSMLPDDVAVVAIDNTPERMDEYAPEATQGGEPIGGKIEEYGDFVVETVAPVAEKRLGARAPTRWRLGTSLGGLEALEEYRRHPGFYQRVVSMSGTFKWGSPHLGMDGPSYAESFKGFAPQPGDKVYLDSGGGRWWPPGEDDNFRATIRVARKLRAAGFGMGDQLFYHHEPFYPPGHPRGDPKNPTNGHNEYFWRRRLPQALAWLGLAVKR